MRYLAPPMAPFAALAIVLACPANAFALEHIHSDAPDVATGTFCVPPGIYQIEQNAQVDVASGGAGPSFSLPSLHRIGLMDDLELRLETPILGYTTAGGVTRDWVAAELKWNIEKYMPEFFPTLALYPTARLEPNNAVTPTFALLTDISLPFQTGLNGNLGVEGPSMGGTVDPADPAPAAKMTFAASVGHRLWAPEWAGYGEVEGDWNPTAGPRVGIDGGIKRRIGDDMQVMLAVGTDALKPGDSYWVTTNCSYRFGKY